MSSRDTQIYRQDAAASGTLLSVEEREKLLRKYLPSREDDEPTPALQPAGPTTATAAAAGATPSATATLPSSSSTRVRAARKPAPPPPPPSSRRRKPIRSFLKTQLFVLVFALVQLAFGLYIRARRGVRAVKALSLRVLYHHHRTPELIASDVAALSRLPRHLSVVLDAPDAARSGAARRAIRKRMRSRRMGRYGDGNGGSSSIYGLEGHGGLNIELEALLDDVAELAAWSAAAGIPTLSIYERRGVLKGMIPGVHATVRARLNAYFGERRAPTLQVRAPHVPSYLNGDDEEEEDMPRRRLNRARAEGSDAEKHLEYDSPTSGGEDELQDEGFARGHLDLLLLSEEDGRATMVDLTKTLAEMSQKGKLSPRDVGIELVDQELGESYSAVDPDLLMLFGDRVVLHGYPPWQLRLTEIFCAGEGTGGAVDYPTWLRGLYRFAKAQMRFGR